MFRPSEITQIYREAVSRPLTPEYIYYLKTASLRVDGPLPWDRHGRDAYLAWRTYATLRMKSRGEAK